MSESNDVVSTRIVAISGLISTISSSNISKLIIAGFFAILLYSLFEQRTILISAIISSPAIAVVFGGFLLLLVIALALNHIFQIQQSRIAHLETQVESDHAQMLEILRKVEDGKP